ncbi:MAG: bifunctional diguanylate cyclase/phosphodiesterase [Amphritea sp.]|nr:bifunctional diguanylate cyclase/phosphodiesterase [Amphritea sp.]
MGHEYGDLLLKETALRLKQLLRDSDFLARYSADEFAVILNPIDSLQRLEHTAQSLLKALSQPFSIDNDSVYISASIGISLFPIDSENAPQLLRNADQAMSAAKAQGRNGYHYFKPAMQEAARKRMQLISELRHAITLNQFELHYQPIIDLSDGQIVKAEALIRWHHPERGLLTPDHFIPLAEETGFIHSLGEWVFTTAAEQLKQWQELGLPTISVSINASPLQLQNGGLKPGDWAERLSGLGLPDGSIVVEITEGLMIETSESVKTTLQQLHSNQFGIAIDDFGTGYSSLAYLKEFDADFLKIDRRFIQNLSSNSDDAALCEAMIVMAHKLGIQVIAEGIETREQLEFIRYAGCDHAQGWLFARALPADGFAAYLQQCPANGLV